jgi:hypothetical protein
MARRTTVIGVSVGCRVADWDHWVARDWESEGADYARPWRVAKDPST